MYFLYVKNDHVKRKQTKTKTTLQIKWTYIKDWLRESYTVKNIYEVPTNFSYIT